MFLKTEEEANKYYIDAYQTIEKGIKELTMDEKSYLE